MDGWMTSTEAKEDSRGPDCIQHAPRTQYASVSVCQLSPHRLAPSDLVVWQTDTGQLFMQWCRLASRGRAISTEDSLEQLKKDARPDDRMQASCWNDASIPFSSPSRLDLCTPSYAFGCTVW